MSDETMPGPACLGPAPMTADRRAEIREVLTGAGPSIPMGPNALFTLRKDRDENRRAAVELLAEVDRLRALWAAVAKTSRDRKAEADGRRQHAEKLKTENERLRKERDAAKAVEAQAVDYVDDLNQQIADAEKRAEQAEAEAAKLRGWDESLSARVTKDLRAAQAEIADLKAQQLTEATAARKNIGRWTEQVKAAEAERDALKAILAEVLAVFSTVTSSETGEIFGYLAPAAAIHPDDFARWRAALDRSDLPAVRAFAAEHDPHKEPPCQTT